MRSEERKAKERQEAHEAYMYYKEHHICTKCRQENAEPGKTMCFACRMKQNERNKVYRDKHREELNAKMREKGKKIYYERKEQGICVRCGKNLPETGKLKCPTCLARDRKVHERYERKNGRMPRYLFGNGEYCHTCGKPVDGTKLCAECLKKAQESLAIARTHIKGGRGWHNKQFLYGSKLK